MIGYAKRHDSTPARGFTLIELVVTLVIIGTLAAIVAPRFFNTGIYQQSGFYNETLASVRYAQKLAIASGCAVQLQFTGNTYTLSQAATLATCNAGTYGTAVPDPSKTGSTYSRTAPSGITASSSPATFVFCPLGNVAAVSGVCPSASTGTFDITVGSQTIRIVRDTGHVCNATASC